MSGYGRIAVRGVKLGMVLAQPARSAYIQFARHGPPIRPRRRPARSACEPAGGQSVPTARAAVNHIPTAGCGCS